MKKLAALALLSLGVFFFGCNLEVIESSENQVSSEKKARKENPSFNVFESEDSDTQNTSENCYTTTLIAGQHNEIGLVTINVDGNTLIVTYTTNEEWVLNATHLHITNCGENSFPVTGANNPKIGHFDYSGEHANGTTSVTYAINLEDISGTLCFAAHAEVTGSSEETAWGRGNDFGGNSWAMYFSADLSNCGNDEPAY